MNPRTLLLVALLSVWVSARSEPIVRVEDSASVNEESFDDWEFSREQGFSSHYQAAEDYSSLEVGEESGMEQMESSEQYIEDDQQMQHQSNQFLNIQSGSVRTSATHMRMAQNGRRSDKVYVKFPKPYQSTPKVVVSVAMFDAYQRNAIRISVYPINVTPHGFSVEFVTWGDSRVWGASATWIGFGV